MIMPWPRFRNKLPIYTGGVVRPQHHAPRFSLAVLLGTIACMIFRMQKTGLLYIYIFFDGGFKCDGAQSGVKSDLHLYLQHFSSTQLMLSLHVLRRPLKSLMLDSIHDVQMACNA